jgi:cation transport ATPase
MAADVVFLNDDISKLPQFIALARKTKYVIMENISMAVIFTFGALGFVAAGYISPVAAAIIHNSSTILIALNSSRLVGYSPGHITSGPGNEGLIRKLL